MALAIFTVIQTPNQLNSNANLVSLAGCNTASPLTLKAGNSINKEIAGVEVGKTYVADISENESISDGKKYNNLRVTGPMEIVTFRDRLDAQVLNQPVKFLTTAAETVADAGAEKVVAGKRK